jgi:H+/gluconate symporter-like permease
MVHDYSFFGSIADFVIKKGTFWIFTGFGNLQMSETLGRNMAVELDSRHPLLPKTG